MDRVGGRSVVLDGRYVGGGQDARRERGCRGRWEKLKASPTTVLLEGRSAVIRGRWRELFVTSVGDKWGPTCDTTLGPPLSWPPTFPSSTSPEPWHPEFTSVFFFCIFFE